MASTPSGRTTGSIVGPEGTAYANRVRDVLRRGGVTSDGPDLPKKPRASEEATRTVVGRGRRSRPEPVPSALDGRVAMHGSLYARRRAATGRRPELGCHDLRSSSCWMQRVRNAPCPCFESRESETIQHTLFERAPPPEDAAATRHVIRHPRRRRPQLSPSRAAYCGPARRLHDDRAGRMRL